MAWTDGVDRAVGFLITATHWNQLLGAAGSLMQLKSHAHGGTTGEGSQSLGPLVLEDFTDAAAAAAPGAGKTRIYATSGRVRFREGAAGTDKLLAKNPMTAAADLIYGGTGGDETRLAAGAGLQLLRLNAGATAPEWTTAPAVHNRTEAKITAGSARDEVATWTTAFSATPAVVCTVNTVSNAGSMCHTEAVSTTAATVRSSLHDGTGNSLVKSVIAQEPT